MFYLLFSNFVVIFYYFFLYFDDQIDPCQIVECEMSKQDHNESFVIKVFIVPKGACEIFVGFLTSVNSICGS
jgi:hypothetical protein